MKMSRQAASLFLLLALVAHAAYYHSIKQLGRTPPGVVKPELLISLPVAAQLLFSAGDRYLAANILGFRVLVAETSRMGRAEYAVQARLQRDISLLNPAHEDNYYVAAAILPWNDELDAAQTILKRAIEKRSFDWQPNFYYAFSEFHFRKNPGEAARWLLMAVPRARDQQDQWALQNLAARWVERGYGAGEAARLVDAIAENASQGNFRKYLQKRAQRLRDFELLHNAVTSFAARFGHRPQVLDDLVRAGVLKVLPSDPLRQGYELDAGGEPVLKGQH